MFKNPSLLFPELERKLTLSKLHPDDEKEIRGIYPLLSPEKKQMFLSSWDEFVINREVDRAILDKEIALLL